MIGNGVILVLEPHASGHRMTYARWLAEGAQRAGYPVVIATTRRAAANPLARGLASSEAEGITLWVEDDEPRLPAASGAAALAAAQWATYRWCGASFRRVAARHQVASVVLPYLDSSAYAIAIAGSPFGGLPWTGITMRMGESGGSGRSWLRSLVMKKVARARGLRALFCINPSARRPSGDKMIDGPRYLPDPAELRVQWTRPEARKRLQIPEDSFVLLVFGTIDHRKGIRQLLAGAHRVAGDRAVTILVAGLQSPELRSLLAQPEFETWRRFGRLVEVNRFLDDADVGTAFAAADAVWLGYVGHDAMSGVAVLAGQAGLPVIACARGEIGHLASTLGTGPVIDVDDPSAVQHAIEELTDARVRAAYAVCSSRAFLGHTPAAFAGAVLEPLIADGTAA